MQRLVSCGGNGHSICESSFSLRTHTHRQTVCFCCIVSLGLSVCLSGWDSERDRREGNERGKDGWEATWRECVDSGSWLVCNIITMMITLSMSSPWLSVHDSPGYHYNVSLTLSWYSDGCDELSLSVSRWLRFSVSEFSMTLVSEPCRYCSSIK